MASSVWPYAKRVLAARFRTRTQAEWTALLEGTDACFAPVLSIEESPHHEHLRARGTFVEIDGAMQPAPAPRFSRTPAALPRAPSELCTANAEHALMEWITPSHIAALRAAGTFN